MAHELEDNEDWLGKNLPLGNIWSEDPDIVERARKFLHAEVNDSENIEEVIDNIRFPLNYSIFSNFDDFVKNLQAIERLANEKYNNVSLENIILWDANSNVKSEEEAYFWLLEFSEVVRDVLREALQKQLGDYFDENEDMPPRKYPLIVSKPRKYFFPE